MAPRNRSAMNDNLPSKIVEGLAQRNVGRAAHTLTPVLLVPCHSRATILGTPLRALHHTASVLTTGTNAPRAAQYPRTFALYNATTV